jgi:uncharacterized protein YciI
MYLIFLRFSHNKNQAATFMQGHNEWIQQGFKSGHFFVVGTIEPKQGGCIWANASSKHEIEEIVAKDPFVVENVVQPEILEVSPSKVDPRFSFLMK